MLPYPMKKTSLILAAAALAGASVAPAATVLSTNSIYIRNDGVAGNTTPNAASPDANQNTDGDIEDIVGWNATTGELRGLYQFDVSTIVNDVNTTGGGNFANLTINSVTLTLFERRERLATSFQIDVYSYGFNFNEATATWNDPDGVAGGDATAGGTFGTLLTSGTVSFGTAGADNDSFTFADSPDFRTALFSAAAGDGSLELILDRPGATTGSSFLSFSSDEQGGGAGLRRPTLTFDYTVVPEPSVALLGGLGLIALLRRRR